jgi:hypothetical protein
MQTPTIAAAVMAELKAENIRQLLKCVEREIAAFADKGRNKLNYKASYFIKLKKRREELQKQLQTL